MRLETINPPELAKLWGVKAATVIGWIRAGQLRAFDVSQLDSKRPRYRIPLDAVEEFQAKRAVVKPKRQRRPPTKREINYFPGLN